MASFISLDPDHKTVYFVDSSGTKNNLSLLSTHGINFSVDGSGNISAVEASSTPSSNPEAVIDLSTMEWSMNFHSGALRMVGIDSVDLGLKMDQRTIDVGSTDYNLKRVANDKVEIRKV